ncbi:MAG: protoporphyrinogen/coproporphyrinogen oxidase [Acidimicrobiia bacterium]
MRVVVVGGGWAGLLTAVNLRARGVEDLVVLERSAWPGGVARSTVVDGYTLEPAAGSFLLPQPGLTPFVTGAVVPTATDQRHVWDGKRLVTVPSGPKAMLAPLASTPAKLRAVMEVAFPERFSEADESLDRFLRRRFGDEVGRTAAWLAASGVFAGDPALLSAGASFPQLTALVETHGSVIRGVFGSRRPRRKSFVPATTMSDLAEMVARPLGDRFRPGMTVDAVRRDANQWVVDGSERFTAEHVVVAIDPAIAARLVGGELGAALRGPVHAPVVVVGLGGRWMELPEGFGVLTGPDAGTATRGVLLESSYAPHRAPHGAGLMKVIAGGAVRPDIVELDDDDVVDSVGNEVARILGHDLDVSFVRVVRHRPGIPQYVLGHREWMAGIDAATPNSLHLTGWGYRGVGLSHLAADAARIADRIAAA